MTLPALLQLPLHEPVAVFTVVLLVLLAAPLIGRLGVPSSVILLAAGVLLGPNASGVLERDPTIILLGTIGLLYIMFLAGLEIDLHEFARHSQRSLILGSFTYALPQILGTAIGLLIFGFGWPGALLLGSVFASHTLLAYPAAARLGLQKENAVTVSVGATILTDTLALLVLAVVASGARAGTGLEPLTLLRVAGPLLIFAVLVLWGLPRIARWFLRRAAQDATIEFVFVLTAVFVCALSVELLGVEAIIGAFLAGLALNRLVPEGGPLMNRIGFFGNALFIPFFLLSTGMLVDLSAFISGDGVTRSWLVAGVMITAVLTTKGLAAWLTRPTFGYTAAEAQLVYGLTVPQAAATLAAVLVGVEVGLFGEAVLNGTIAMVIVTCFLGPWLVESAGRRLAMTAKTQSESAERSRLLVALGNPATVAPLMDLALLAREPSTHEPLVTVTVAGVSAEREVEVLRGERLLSEAVVYAAGASVPVLPLVRSEANVARALARAALETRATTLLMGWDGGVTAERLLFGSILDRLLRETSAAVLIARLARPLATATRFVLALPPLAVLAPDFARTVRFLTGLASRAGVNLVVLTPEPHHAAVRTAFASAHRGATPEFLPLAIWNELPNTLDTLLTSSDVLILISARQGEVAWRTSLERLPRVLAQRFNSPLLVLYPSQSLVSVRSTDLTGQQGLLEHLRSDRIRVDLDPGPVPALLRKILNVPDSSPVIEALLGASLDVRRELRPGVLLTHAHTAAVEEPILAVGTSRERRGLGIPGSEPVFVLAVLAVPEHVPSATYLGWLALIARAFRADDMLEALKNAETPEAVRTVLLNRFRRLDSTSADDGLEDEALSTERV